MGLLNKDISKQAKTCKTLFPYSSKHKLYSVEIDVWHIGVFIIQTIKYLIKELVGKWKYGDNMAHVSRKMQDGPAEPARIPLQALSE